VRRTGRQSALLPEPRGDRKPSTEPLPPRRHREQHENGEEEEEEEEEEEVVEEEEEVVEIGPTD